MKRKANKLIIGIIFLAGLSLLLYPFVANQWNNYRQKQLISSYEQTVSEKTVDKLQKRLETLEKALEEIYVAIDSRMKQLGGTGKVYNTIYADDSRRFNGKIEHS